jgi:hypothetical protein
MLLTAIGAFIGALLSFLASIYIEYQRKPKLSFEIEDPPFDANYTNADAKKARFVRVYLQNKPMPHCLRWIDRDPAMQCYGNVEFYHIVDGDLVLVKPMPIRWSLSDEPFSSHIMPGNQIVRLFDPTKYSASFYRNCFPGIKELIDVAGRFDDDDDCYGWSTDYGIPEKGWRNQDLKIPKGRYFVKVTVFYSGEPVSSIFKLENSVARQNFRLNTATQDDLKKFNLLTRR